MPLESDVLSISPAAPEAAAPTSEAAPAAAPVAAPAPEAAPMAAATGPAPEAAPAVSAPPRHPDMRWYTLHVYSTMEKSVHRAVTDRIAQSGKLREFFGEVLLPTEKVQENRNGKRVETERRIYPGYLFIEMVMNEDTWHLINSTPRVIEFLGRNKPVPLAPREIDSIRGRINVGVGEKARPKVLFEPGQRVRIKEGPFTDFEGRVEEVMNDKNRLRCFVSIFGRETSVELAFAEVEKA